MSGIALITFSITVSSSYNAKLRCNIMEILLLILANNFLSALKKSTSFASNVPPQLHFSPVWDGDSTAKHSGQTATLKIILPASGV